MIKKLFAYPRYISNQNQELIWSSVWHDTIRGMDWIQGLPSISPGRWAVGYNYLYVMTRILNDVRPHKVLDIGLGISSVLFSTYFDYFDYDDGMHVIAEHDPNWIDFCKREKNLSKATLIEQQTLVKKKIGGAEVNAYADLAGDIRDMKFSVISVDGPFGSEHHSRGDILPLIPDILEDSFVIVFDDTNCKGEQETIRDLLDRLQQHGISYEVGRYRGCSDCTVIVSADYKFLTSM